MTDPEMALAAATSKANVVSCLPDRRSRLRYAIPVASIAAMPRRKLTNSLGFKIVERICNQSKQVGCCYPQGSQQTGSSVAVAVEGWRY